MKLRITILIIAALTTIAGCGSQSGNRTGTTPEIKKGVAPVPDNEIAVIQMENPGAFGTIKIELYSNLAPKAVARFKELAREGFFDGITFHRVNESVIQGGDPLTRDDDPENDGTGGSDKPNVPAEFSDIPYEAGIVGAARSQEPNSANSQFFITLKRETGFDERYTVFGKVIEGMNNVRAIAGADPKDGERPVEPIRIRTVLIQPRN